MSFHFTEAILYWEVENNSMETNHHIWQLYLLDFSLSFSIQFANLDFSVYAHNMNSCYICWELLLLYLMGFNCCSCTPEKIVSWVSQLFAGFTVLCSFYLYSISPTSFVLHTDNFLSPFSPSKWISSFFLLPWIFIVTSSMWLWCCCYAMGRALILTGILVGWHAEREQQGCWAIHAAGMGRFVIYLFYFLYLYLFL